MSVVQNITGEEGLSALGATVNVRRTGLVDNVDLSPTPEAEISDLNTKYDLRFKFSTSNISGDIKAEKITNSELVSTGGVSQYVVGVTLSSYTISLNDRIIGVSHTDTGPVALTLPPAASCWDATESVGKCFAVKDIGCNASVNNITINRAGSDTITSTTRGNSSYTLSTDGSVVWVQAVSATEWAIL